MEVENVEALDEVNKVLSAALADELEDELREELVGDVEDDKVAAVLEEELLELGESEDDVEVLVVDVDGLILDAKLAALTVALEDEVFEDTLLELLLLGKELLPVVLVLVLIVLLVVGIRVAGLTVTLVEEFEEILSVLLVVELLVVELLEELLEELVEVLLRDAALDVELLVVVEVLVVELVADSRVAALAVTLEEVGEVLKAELLDDELVIVPPLVDIELEGLAAVRDVELVEELLLVDPLLVVDTSEAASTVGLEEDGVPVEELLENLLVLVEIMLLVEIELEELAVVLDDELMTEILLVSVPLMELDTKLAALTVGIDEVDEDDVVPIEEPLVALGEELVVALEGEDETVERLLSEALLVVDRSVAALTIGLDEEDREREEEDVLDRILVIIVTLLVEATVDELADELRDGEELLADLLEAAAVELVLEDDPAALFVVGSSVAALAAGLADVELLNELLLDGVLLEMELELTAELGDGRELLLELLEEDATVLLLVGSSVAAFAVGLADDEILEMDDEEVLGGIETPPDVVEDEAVKDEVPIDDKVLGELLSEALEVVDTNVAVDDELSRRLLEEDAGLEAGLLIDEVEEVKVVLKELES
ncbi:hypothetical protein COL5a_010994 [Colletotrichum fioriniae]|uniref:uncharacterized protein n=1 Tax=Colletotrichum fioriniae TaxID=710243 RepID=UPI0032DACB19|nr:hypothetical protein COL5a_010994 [Colletotrichum fioriniae]KAJ3939441.1 hypothetical protein N0V96_010217 [Colletotrichum fioriniae]